MSSEVQERKEMSLRAFKPYPKYKDSGVEWLGKIPAHWEAKRLKRLFKVVNGSTPRSEEPSYWDGDIPWVTPDDLGELTSRELLESRRYITEDGYHSCGTSMVPKGSLILSTRAPIGHLAIAGVNLCTNQGCRSLVFLDKSNRNFFYYQLLASRLELESWGQGSTFRELSKTKLEYVPLISPPFDEQYIIAEFLDRERAKIDHLVAKKERLIELLQEKRTALITRAVTKGLGTNVLKKASDVEWIGEIPSHWEVKRLKYIIRGGVQNGIFKKKEYYGSGTLLVNVFDIYQNDFLVKEAELERVEADEAEKILYSVQNGDIFFVRSSLKLEGVGKSACALEISEPIMFECHLVRAQPNNKQILSEYLINYLNSVLTMQRLISLSNTVTMSTIDQQEIACVEILIPTVDEQKAILRYLHIETEKISLLIKKAHEGIERLKEYRTALISAAVTGKIDVRGGLHEPCGC